MTNDSIQCVQQKWRRCGYTFAVKPHDGAVNPADLIVNSVKHMRAQPDLFEATTTWLSRFGDLIAWRYLLWLAKNKGFTPRELAILGHVLESSDQFAGTTRFRRACSLLSGFSQHECPVPLSQQSESMHEYVDALKKHASPTSLRWGILVGDAAPRYDSLESRPAVFARNPAWFETISSNSDIEKSIMEFLHVEPAGLSKSELARRCGATRSAIHAPADRLMRCHKIQQVGTTRNARLCLLPNAISA